MAEPYYSNALPLGSLLQEYELKEILGAGTFGIVYLAEGTYLHEQVAIKEYLPADLATRTADSTVSPVSSDTEEHFVWGRKKFLSEARILYQLGQPDRHPNIVAVRRFFEANDTAYMVMDYEQGEPLSEIIKASGRSRKSA